MARPKRSAKKAANSNSASASRRKALPDQDTSNDAIYNESDAYFAEKTRIALDSENEGSSDGEPADESVFNLDDESSSEGDSEEDDSEDDLLDQLPEHLRRAAKRAAAGEAPDDSDSSGDDEDAHSNRATAANWGKSKKAYYDADTADLEIGQEFADAEDEEAAALELQRASYSRLTAADFDDDAVSSDNASDGGEGSDAEDHTNSNGAAAAAVTLGDRLQQQQQADSSHRKQKKGSKAAAAAGVSGSDAAGLRGELEALLSGRGSDAAAAFGTNIGATSAGGVEIATVKRDLSKLSKRDKLAIVVGDAPELPGLCASLQATLVELCERIEPLAQDVTADLGASNDGLLYLQAKRQLLLGMAMNTCFYMLLKASGYRGVKGHPVMQRLLQFTQLSHALQPVDEELAPQVDLLVQALSAGIDIARTSDGSDADSEADDDSTAAAAAAAAGAAAAGEHDGTDSGSSGDSSSSEGEYTGMDDDELDAEEERYMHGTQEAKEEAQQAAKAAAKAAKRAARSSTKANSSNGVLNGSGSAQLADYGDEEVPETAGSASGSKNNPLQSLLNSIQQKERAAARSSAHVTRGDAEVSGQRRGDVTQQRQRRPAPGGGDSDDDMAGLFGDMPQAALDYFAGEGSSSGGAGKSSKKRPRDSSSGPREQEGSDDEFLNKVAAQQSKKRQIKDAKYKPALRIAGTLEEELAAERERKGMANGPRGASYEIIKNRGLTPHKSKLNRNPRVKKREAYRKAVIRRKGQVVDVRTNEAGRYGGEGTGIRSTITRSRKLAG